MSGPPLHVPDPVTENEKGEAVPGWDCPPRLFHPDPLADVVDYFVTNIFMTWLRPFTVN